MNYEEKYKKSLKVIESLYNVVRYQSSSDALFASQTIEKAFPELKESEDERIKKEIIQFLQLPHPQFVGKRNYEEWIAWLEKQDEQKFAWSEEDEKMLSSIIKEVYPYGECPDYPNEEEREYYYTHQNMVDWLKSIKPNHWKPSEEQISMLLAVLNDSNNITAESVHIALKSLYNDLKKLWYDTRRKTTTP